MNPSTGGFEIEFVDGSGRIRWKVVRGGLEERVRRALRHRDFGSHSRPLRRNGSLSKHTYVHEPMRDARALRRHVFPRIGECPISTVDEEAIANLVRDLEAQGLSGWTIKGVLIPLGRVLRYAVRQKLAPYNAVSRLERSERPRITRREKRILTADEIEALLRATPKTYRPIIATAVFTGLRLSELLGLWWGDVDLDNGALHVRRQLDRTGNYSEPKTQRSARTVVLSPSLVALLREHRDASTCAGPGDTVFATETGRPMYYRNVTRRGLAVGIDRAGINRQREPRLRFHDLRHTYASLLIAQGLNVIFVSRQLGHAFPSFTLNTYGGLFDRVENANRAAAGLEAAFPPSLDEGETGTARSA